jgi:mannosyl-3-phosphoglycerate phosphatase
MNDLKIIVMTDLDGTLLDQDTFEYEPVKSYMAELLDSGVGIVLNSSKTWAELEYFCRSFGRQLPYVSENGAAIYNADSLLGLSNIKPNAYQIFGRPVADLKMIWSNNISTGLRKKCLFLDETERSVQSSCLGLTGESLARAMTRGYSRPFLFKGSDSEFKELQKQANELKLNVLRGGRVCNLSALHDKANCITLIRDLVDSNLGKALIVGVGDSDNDVSMLEAADIACVIPRKNELPLTIKNNKTCQRVIHASRIAPLGWQEAVAGAIAFLKTDHRCSNG